MLVPIIVIIGLKTEKKRTIHGYPDFNSIRDVVKSWNDGSDWSNYVDRYGGWHYDSVSGHQDEDSENNSPLGSWLGMLCVPADFAEAAVRAFPNQVKILDENECRKFYEERVTIGQSEIIENTETLQALAAKRALGISEASDDNALDPDHPQIGRSRNKVKTWDGYKKQRGVHLDSAEIQRLRNLP